MLSNNDPFDLSTALVAIQKMQERIYAIAREAAGMPLEGMIAHLELLERFRGTLGEEWLKHGANINYLTRMAKLLKQVSNEYNNMRKNNG